MKNVQADTSMRAAIAREDAEAAPESTTREITPRGRGRA
jgi:hypothetical protein